MRKLLCYLYKAMKTVFIVFCVFILSLLFRSQRLPDSWVECAIDSFVPTNLVVHIESVSIGFVRGVSARNLRVFDRRSKQALEPIVSARALTISPVRRLIEVDELSYPRLPETYYAPGNQERNERVAMRLPELPQFKLVATRPRVLGVEPERIEASVSIAANRFSVERIRLDWPREGEPMYLDGYCIVDLNEQYVYGEVDGTARQQYIRPLLVALDLPPAVEYIDAFTEVPGKVPAKCEWRVNLVNADFDLFLDLHPKMGKYRGVKLDKADGKIHLHVTTRGNSLNYRNEIGPIIGVGPKGEPLEGTIMILGENGTNTVNIVAKSALPVAHLLKIGGFEDDYVDDSVVGDSSCDLNFVFPRWMGKDLSQMRGKGHIVIKDGQLMRLKGLHGLIELLAEHCPGFSLITDSTQGSCDYVIENGCLTTDNIYIEGSVFSIKMYGQMDFVNNTLDFTVRVQFSKKDSIVGKILHPLTWPFTKLLLEFKLSGSVDEPKWQYISVIDRVLEVAK